jgi:hypothetical protein
MDLTGECKQGFADSAHARIVRIKKENLSILFFYAFNLRRQTLPAPAS